MRDGARRFANEAMRAGQPVGFPPAFAATVMTVTAGAAQDGNALVTVSYRGATFAAAYSASYTPVVGHVVKVTVVRNQPIIDFRIIGTP